jgi:staphylococcal nuclease domain-containing protein 1
LVVWRLTGVLAIIEATPSADRFRARVLFSDGSQQIIPIVLSGVRSPSASKKAGAGEDVPGESGGQAEEFGDEARWFVESKLLQRNVKVELMYVPICYSLICSGLNQAGSMFVAKVKHPAGDIAQLLVLNGLARCADWMSPMLGGDGMQKLRDAERYQNKQNSLNGGFNK